MIIYKCLCLDFEIAFNGKSLTPVNHFPALSKKDGTESTAPPTTNETAPQRAFCFAVLPSSVREDRPPDPAHGLQNRLVAAAQFSAVDVFLGPGFSIGSHGALFGVRGSSRQACAIASRSARPPPAPVPPRSASPLRVLTACRCPSASRQLVPVRSCASQTAPGKRCIFAPFVSSSLFVPSREGGHSAAPSASSFSSRTYLKNEFREIFTPFLASSCIAWSAS